MGTVLLRLAGPLQAWGCDSRFTERKTRHEPTKSGVVGMLAAAFGRKREDPVEDLACLPFAVRIDQEGSYERDFQTARTRKYHSSAGRWLAGKSLPLSYRYYLSDAVFVAAIEVPDDKLPQYEKALIHPAFPLYLGRRSCSPAGRVLIGTRAGVGILQALADHPWEATKPALIRRHQADQLVCCEVVRDTLPSDGENVMREAVRDVPVSFSQQRRTYSWRTVSHERIGVPNPHFVQANAIEHDPMGALERMSTPCS